MTWKVRVALLKSIWKWVKIAFFRGVDLGGANCALCQLCRCELHAYSICENCPIHQDVNLFGCDGTPYQHWNDVTDRVRCWYQFKLALNELAYLIGLFFRRFFK